MAKIKVTQIRSTNKETDRQKANIKALGLKKIRSSVIQPDNPAIRGMIFTVKHMVSVEEIAE